MRLRLATNVLDFSLALVGFLLNKPKFLQQLYMHLVLRPTMCIAMKALNNEYKSIEVR